MLELSPNRTPPSDPRNETAPANSVAQASLPKVKIEFPLMLDRRNADLIPLLDCINAQKLGSLLDGVGKEVVVKLSNAYWMEDEAGFPGDTQIGNSRQEIFVLTGVQVKENGDCSLISAENKEIPLYNSVSGRRVTSVDWVSSVTVKENDCLLYLGSRC